MKIFHRLVKTLLLILIVVQVVGGCAARLQPAYLTELNFAKLPALQPIVAVPLSESRKEIRMSLDTVFFAVDKATLLPEGRRKIAEFAQVIQQYPSRALLIEGHTDSSGDAAYNQDLSKRRANTVREALIAQGIESQRFTIKAYGEKNPIASNATRKGRQQNRRVELVILTNNF
jgi:OOP family OmpA-OmpF porin